MWAQEAQLPLWLRPYEVLVTSNRTALIELIPDSLSIHTIKAKSAPGTSLREHFLARHGQVWSACSSWEFCHRSMTPKFLSHKLLVQKQ